MNRHCGGLWFTVPGSPVRYYRCLLDGRILPGALAPATRTCPHCRRPVKAWRGGEAEELDVRTVRQVRLPEDLGGGWQELPG